MTKSNNTRVSYHPQTHDLPQRDLLLLNMKTQQQLPRTKQINAILNKIDRTERICTLFASVAFLSTVVFVMHYNDIFNFIFG